VSQGRKVAGRKVAGSQARKVAGRKVAGSQARKVAGRKVASHMLALKWDASRMLALIAWKRLQLSFDGSLAHRSSLVVVFIAAKHCGFYSPSSLLRFPALPFLFYTNSSPTTNRDYYNHDSISHSVCSHTITHPCCSR